MSKNPDICVNLLKLLNKTVQKIKKKKEQEEDTIRENLKQIYDFTKSEEIKTIKSSALPALIVSNDFDLEQIWQQIELQNQTTTVRCNRIINALIRNKNELHFTHLKRSKDEESAEPEQKPNKEDEEKNEDIDNENSNEEIDSNETSDSDENDDNIPLEDEEEEEIEEERLNNKKKHRKSVVDDQFFKLDEMEAFLQAEERKTNDPDSGRDSNEDDEEINEEEEDDDYAFSNNDIKEDDPEMAKYGDFFEARQEEKQRSKRNKFLEQEEDNEDDDNLDQEADEEFEEKSTFEKRQERLEETIGELEESAINEKPWQLKGEIKAKDRPLNSLLEEVVDFQMTSRPAPIITENTTFQLEDLIKQRIKDKAFDSVERKVRPTETPQEFRKKLVLDQEKSKESLAKIYENEFVEKQNAANPLNDEKEEEVPELHKEVDNLLTSLFHKLDSLSNFHFTPKPVLPELKIVKNVPAMNMEEVAPVTVSDAQLLAPEEVKRKPRRDIKGKDERNRTDKNRARRLKKIKQKTHAKLKSERDAKSNKAPKEVKGQNIVKMKESGKSMKSSTAFFSKLEDEVKTQIKKGTKRKHTKINTSNNLEAKKFKL